MVVWPQRCCGYGTDELSDPAKIWIAKAKSQYQANYQEKDLCNICCRSGIVIYDMIREFYQQFYGLEATHYRSRFLLHGKRVYIN